MVWSLQRLSPKFKPLAMNSHSLSTWTAIVWSLQRPSLKSKPKGTSHFIPCPKQPLQSNGKYLVSDWLSLKKHWRHVDRSLGFHNCPIQTSSESLSPSSKRNHFKLWQPLDFDLSVKGREAELLQYYWWESTASQPSAIMWSAPKWTNIVMDDRWLPMIMCIWRPYDQYAIRRLTIKK
jgi:hypothetical protein